MIELLELVTRLTKKIPDYSKSRRIRVDLGTGYSKLVIVGLEDDVIFYQFATDRDRDNWSRWSSLTNPAFRWVAEGVVEDLLDLHKVKPSIMSRTGAIIISARKIPSKEWVKP